MSNFQWKAAQLQLDSSVERNSNENNSLEHYSNHSLQQLSRLQGGSYYSNRDKKTHFIHGINSQKQLVIVKKPQLTYVSKTPQAQNQHQAIGTAATIIKPSQRNEGYAAVPGEQIQKNNQKLTMMDEELNVVGGIISHPHLLKNEGDSNGSRERFMIHRRMSNTGIVNISTINAAISSNPTLKRRNIQTNNSESHQQQFSSADKQQTSKNRFQVSPYSVKNNITKFPPSQHQQQNPSHVPKNQSYNYSESKQGKKIMHLVSGVPQVVDMIPSHHLQETNNNLSTLTRSVGIVNNQQINDAKFKSGTTIANNNGASSGGGNVLSELKQHFPPLDPKSATNDQVQQSNMKKKYVKNGFGSSQDIVLFSAHYNNNANSFVETSPIPINIKKVGNDQFDQVISDDQQVMSNPNRFYPSHDSQSKSGQYFHQDEARVIMTKTDMKNRHAFNNSAQLTQQSPYITLQQQQLQIANSQNDMLMKKNQSIIKKQVADTKKIKNLNPNQSPAGMSRNVVQSQNLMLASPGGSGSIFSPPHQQHQQRPHESHSHTRASKLRYNHPQIKAQYIKRGGGGGVPPPAPHRTFGSIIDQKGFTQQQQSYLTHQQDGSSQYLANNSNNHRDSIIQQIAPNRGEQLNSDGTLMLPLQRNSDNFTTTGDPNNNFENPPDSFTERFSSIDQDELENTIKIGRGGEGDMDEDIRLFRDIEIRLKIEPLTIKLIHSITERIRSHVHAQGKLALSNLVGLLYQQFVKLSQRLSVSPPSNTNNGGGASSTNSQQEEQKNNNNLEFIKQLQAINSELNAEIDSLQSEIRHMRQGRGGVPNLLDNLNSSPKTNLQVQELRRRNFELQNEMEHIKERLAIYENQNGESDQMQSLENTLNTNQSPILKKHRGHLVPKLNLQKALQLNMKLFKPANLNNMSNHQFHAPLESSNRGSYMSFKLQQFPVGDNEGIPVAQASLDQQPLVRPTTTMGGRKKLVQNNNIKNTSIEEITSEVSGGHDTGNSPQMESMPRPVMKQLKFKKLGTQHAIEESGNSGSIPNINLQPINSKNKPGTAAVNQAALSMKKFPGKVKGFHDEFMDKYDEFSLSWREAIDREKRF